MHHIFSKYGPVERVVVVEDAKVSRVLGDERRNKEVEKNSVAVNGVVCSRRVDREAFHLYISRVTKTQKPRKNSVREWRLTEGGFEWTTP